MNPANNTKKLALAIGLTSALFLTQAPAAWAQSPTTSDDATVTYPASFFDQFQPFSVNDMLQRIPGINLALGGGGGSSQGGPGSSSGGGRRGLGAGGDQVLINGRRIAGKGNEGNSQLSRIPAKEVEYIQIIRGTSGDLDVRGGNQVINIVLTEAQSNVSYAYEVNMDHYHDDTLMPGSKISATGQNGAFNYFLSAEIEPRWEYRDGFEESFNVDGSLNQTVKRDEETDAQPTTLVANMGYEFNPRNTANLNLQWTDNDFDNFTDRIVTDFDGDESIARFERDNQPTTDSSWEVGGDYMHVFGDGSRWKTLFIVNEAETNSVRDRFIVDADTRTKDLHLTNYVRNQERIVRSSYIFDFLEKHNIEAGVERAQTILDTSLQLGLLDEEEPGDPRFGGLSPVTDSIGTVEEMRYEYFAIHNWAMNDRMTLETTLLFEDSTISQEGTQNNSRDFTFFRPKVDYRFDVTPAIQFRATIEKDVAQLSFRDFTAGVDESDDEQNDFEGNAELRQEQSWRYEANVEFRLPNDAGVINTNLYYHDLEDLIDNVDVSTEDTILSARGNIGDGERYGLNFNSSLRLNFINQPNMLLTAGLNIEESTVTDPFLQRERERSIRGGASRYSIGFRHDLPQLNNTNWGFNYRREFWNDFTVWDVDKIEQYPKVGSYFAWVETQAWGGLVYRFEARDSRHRCRVRTRYTNGTIATGIIEEIEDSCSDAGPVLAIKIRGTF
ncbi:MAG: TonB-dependent receptor plug domain-containing protein [Pseudomonadales bacterium]|nr:TonB-dependent receptor plug domain-containing protein [Pseudomonadales bacterium]